jgi:hypothetical protein
LIGPCRSSIPCATNGRHCTHSGPHGNHMGGNLAPKCQNCLSPHKRLPLHPQWAARQPYGGNLAPTCRHFLSARRSSTRCATNGRRCTHGACQPHGESWRESVVTFYRPPPLIRPMRPKTAATASTVGRTAAIWGRNLAPKCRSPPLILPMRHQRPPLHPQWAAR